MAALRTTKITREGSYGYVPHRPDSDTCNSNANAVTGHQRMRSLTAHDQRLPSVQYSATGIIGVWDFRSCHLWSLSPGNEPGVFI